jgi:GNAT superfamily N-acetyltransferase
MITLRAPRPEDAQILGRICYDAFGAISDEHNFPRDFPSVEAAQGMMSSVIGHPGMYGVVAEEDGRVLGSNWMDVRGPVFGIGPITVDPGVQNVGVGKRLMEAMIERTAEAGAPGVRLLQAGYHRRSLSLYAKLGFDVREPLACMTGPAIGELPSGCEARPATTADIEACNALCRKVHGHDRGGELSDAVAQGTASVVLRGGRITGYASQVAYFGHAVGETSDDIKALIAASGEVGAPGILVPMRNSDLFRWCLDNDLRVTQTLTLMTRGLYGEPAGAWMPSILY